MNTKNYLKFLASFACLFLLNLHISAQCTTFLAEYSNFGNAPIVVEGCPQYKVLPFEIYASESYTVDNFVAGNQYAFNICNGDGAGNIIPDFAIVAPSGAVDAFGTGDGDSCTISWTASENGTYQIIINELDFCGGGANTESDNGFGALTIITDEECDTSFCILIDGGLNPSGYSNFATLGGAPCDDGSGCGEVIVEIAAWAAELYQMPGIQQGGEYSFDMCSGVGAGTWIPEFTIVSPSGNVDASGFDQNDTCRITWVASETGEYLIFVNEAGNCGGGDNTGTNNGFPRITCLGGTMCDTTTMMMDSCIAGNLLSEPFQAICSDTSQVIMVYDGEAVPEAGRRVILFTPGEGGTGGLNGAFVVNVGAFNVGFDNDLNGTLSSNNLDPFAGQWFVNAAVASDSIAPGSSLCAVSSDTIEVVFNSEIVATSEDLGAGMATVAVEGGTAPYTYLWSDAAAQTTDTLTVSEEGDYTVMVTDAVGCTAQGTVSIMISSVENLPGVEELVIAPNPTDGQLYVNISHNGIADVSVQIIDMNGRTTTSQKVSSTQRKLNFDLTDYANGVYMVRVTSGKYSTTQRVVLAK